MTAPPPMPQRLAVRQWPLYAWLIAAYPIVSIAASNVGQVTLRDAAAASAVAVLVASMVALVYRALLGNWHKAALATAAAITLFYAYGPVATRIDAWWLDMSDHGELFEAAAIAYRAPLVLSALWLLVLAAASFGVYRLRDELPIRMASPLNVVTGALLVIAAVQGLTSELARARVDDGTVAADVPTHAAAAGERPDIYYIVLDGYARADILEQYYGHDNAPFLDALRAGGFVVNDRGYANYYWTFLSLASSLNMDYLPAIIGAGQDPRSRDPSAAYDAIRDNRVARILREQGYRYFQLQSTWGATLANPHADVFVSCGSGLFVNEFYRAIAEASWLRALSARASANLASCHQRNFASLARIGAEPGPKFVFAHFILPHHPYVFDRHGSVLHDATIANQFDFQARLWEKRSAYLDQLLYVNDAVLAAIRDIRARSARPPVIILQSDHGPQLNDGLDDPERRNVRLANFAAFLTPGAPPDLIPRGDSPVNLFRRVLSFYAGTDLPVLPNRHFYSPYGRPYDLEDVTDVIEAGQRRALAGVP